MKVPVKFRKKKNQDFLQRNVFCIVFFKIKLFGMPLSNGKGEAYLMGVTSVWAYTAHYCIRYLEVSHLKRYFLTILRCSCLNGIDYNLMTYLLLDWLIPWCFVRSCWSGICTFLCSKGWGNALRTLFCSPFFLTSSFL